MIPLVCYSNSEYLDVLRVQNAFLQSVPGSKILITNKVPDIQLAFDTVRLYDDRLSYSKRVLAGLQEIDAEFVLFYHDMDILLRYSPSEISDLAAFMRSSNIDRVDLQYSALQDAASVRWRDLVLTRSNAYIYNVNPSVWRRSVLIDIMTKFDKSYRAIEDSETQAYCSRFTIFKLWSPVPVRAGYFNLTPFFVFLHLTHGGKLAAVESNNMDPWIHATYRGILSSFSFTREIRRTLH